MSRRVHITGASGSGTTTLGRALAGRWTLSGSLTCPVLRLDGGAPPSDLVGAVESAIP